MVHITRGTVISSPCTACPWVLRVRFSEWLLQKNTLNPRSTADVLVTDEIVFTRNGIHNVHDTHVWDIENPHSIQRDHFQHGFSLIFVLVPQNWMRRAQICVQVQVCTNNFIN